MSKKRLGLSPIEAIKLSQFLYCTVLTLIFIGSALAVIYSKHLSRDIYANVQDIESHKDRCLDEFHRLLSLKSRLLSSAKIEQYAAEKLHMSAPKPKDSARINL